MESLSPGRLLLIGFLLACSGPEILGQPQTQTVILSSGGGGPPGTPDPLITYLAGPALGPFPAPFTQADFQAAATGPSAVVATVHPNWLPSLAASPLAHQWIGTHSPDGSVLCNLPNRRAESGIHRMSRRRSDLNPELQQERLQ